MPPAATGRFASVDALPPLSRPGILRLLRLIWRSSADVTRVEVERLADELEKEDAR